MVRLKYLAFAAFNLCLIPPVALAVNVDGSFAAAQQCPAYVSIKHKTNPDQATIQTGQKYRLVEINMTNQPSWYRVEIPSVNPSKRWVAAHCGEADYLNAAVGSKDKGEATATAQCRTTDRIDSYVFAVSWQPAFCESHQAKPECEIHSPQAYQASHFTLHGLWPNQNSCGTDYGFCSDVAQQKQFCDYRPVPMSLETEKALGVVMPSVAAGSCLDRHEWYKHGTCQTGSADEYFETAMSLLQQFNDSGIAAFIAANVGKPVKLDSFLQKIDQSLGEGAHERMKLGCDKQKNLVDIYVNLPKTLAPDSSLKELIEQGTPGFSDGGCEPSFKVDRI